MRQDSGEQVEGFFQMIHHRCRVPPFGVSTPLEESTQFPTGQSCTQLLMLHVSRFSHVVPTVLYMHADTGPYIQIDTQSSVG
jgi:hypothetical protein